MAQPTLGFSNPSLLLLSTEVICGHIIPYLSLQTRYAMASVCKYLHRVTFDNPITWQVIDFSDAENRNFDINYQVARLLDERLSQTSIQSIRSITLESTFLTRKGLNSLIKHCVNLRELSLNDCIMISVREILMLLEIHPIPSLRHLLTRNVPCSKESVVELRKLLYSYRGPREPRPDKDLDPVLFDRYVCEICSDKVARYEPVDCHSCGLEQIYMCPTCLQAHHCYSCKANACQQCSDDSVCTITAMPCRKCRKKRSFCQNCLVAYNGSCQRCSGGELVVHELRHIMSSMSVSKNNHERLVK